MHDKTNEILSGPAIEFLNKLHTQFNKKRLSLLDMRHDRQGLLDRGSKPAFLSETLSLRQDPSWKTAWVPKDLERRRVEITGPVERKMMINAFNSGADVFMADFEDAFSPTWANVIQGQVNLIDAVNKNLSYTSPEGKAYTLNDVVATLMVRPRGWHLEEKHFKVNGENISASLFDFGLYFFHNAHALLKNGTGPYFYLPKLENHLEARLWNDVFLWSQEQLGIPEGSIKATVLIETILAAFEMEEILYELRNHIVGLNAGRWDYIFSIIKKFRLSSFVFPDRGQITMTVPFMRAYTDLLVHTCHKRGAHALGGMAAFIPSRKDKALNEIALKKVREDKEREAADGFDGTWVAHPDLVLTAMEVFNQTLKDRPHQKDKPLSPLNITSGNLLDFTIPLSSVSEAGIRQNINISMLYVESWLNGVGAAALYNLMEDTATAEISRAQLWQWFHQPSPMQINGQALTLDYFKKLTEEEYIKIAHSFPPGKSLKKLGEARRLIESLVLSDHFEDFLTLPAYELIYKEPLHV